MSKPQLAQYPNWLNLISIGAITPNDILRVTAFIGEEIAELAIFLDTNFPGLKNKFAERYVLSAAGKFPKGTLPAEEPEIRQFIGSLSIQMDQGQKIAKVVDKYYPLMPPDCPQYSTDLLLSLALLHLGDLARSVKYATIAEVRLNTARILENAKICTQFERIVALDPPNNEILEAGMAPERNKAAILAELIMEMRRKPN